MANLPSFLGKKFLNLVNYLVELSTLWSSSFAALLMSPRAERRFSFQIMLRQILFTGIEALPTIGTIALFLGVVVIIQSLTQLPRFGGEEYVGKILVLVILRELGPLMTAFLVIGRSGTAISTEIGNMIVAHEIEALKVMGIDTRLFIVAPRILGVTIAVVCLSLYFDLIALIGGFIVAKLILITSFSSFTRTLFTSITGTDLLISLLKSFFFGNLIALICLYQGFSVNISSTEVPQATTRAIVQTLFLVFLANSLLTLLFYL
jgi:phospholipid/cholesterol/gamma-HCH transport system permease protein